jgi:hypothetical protein
MHLRSSCTRPCCSGKIRRKINYFVGYSDSESDSDDEEEKMVKPVPVATPSARKRIRRSLSETSGYSTNDDYSDNDDDMELDEALPVLSSIVKGSATTTTAAAVSSDDEETTPASPAPADSSDEEVIATTPTASPKSSAAVSVSRKRSPRLSADDFLTTDLPKSMVASPFRTRLRAVRKMGVTMPFWECGRCPYWHYHSGKVLKHQGMAGH